MKTTKMILAAILTAFCCTEMAAQIQRDTLFMVKIDYVTPVTNVSMTHGPQLLSGNSVKFTVRAPEAQKVQVDIGGTKYDMTKGDGGIWTVTTNPQVPGFHYYSLIIDGVSVADPASQSFYGCSRWSSAIE
ncbi:MAG: esterase, partial [Prevotella sp.]|nr:esterase [Prevotella sp.]